MEEELRTNLHSCAVAFAAARRFELSTVGRMAANDGSFFSRIATGRSFTARKYDEIIQWFSDNWPVDAVWPADVRRPSPSSSHVPSVDTAANGAVEFSGEGHLG